ncbi:MAG: hypothetical protein KBB86_03480 [Candidatus Pacebacteria bacterium]|nr:hypothetical protein [Candidatus Paceibacterota bacterium]
MTIDEVKELAQKVKDGNSTQEEELALLKYLNEGVEQMREFVKEVMTSDTNTENNTVAE